MHFEEVHSETSTAVLIASGFVCILKLFHKLAITTYVLDLYKKRKVKCCFNILF